MTELRRSSRGEPLHNIRRKWPYQETVQRIIPSIRQSAKLSGQYYEPDEKKTILATPDVRPRKWKEAVVTAGYFKIRKWVPRDQQHLTAELHGGLTDPADVAAAAKHQLNFRMGKSSSRLKNRTRAGAAAAAAAAASASSGGTPSKLHAAPAISRFGGHTSPVEGLGAGSPPWVSTQPSPSNPAPDGSTSSSSVPQGGGISSMRGTGVGAGVGGKIASARDGQEKGERPGKTQATELGKRPHAAVGEETG